MIFTTNEKITPFYLPPISERDLYFLRFDIYASFSVSMKAEFVQRIFEEFQPRLKTHEVSIKWQEKERPNWLA